MNVYICFGIYQWRQSEIHFQARFSASFAPLFYVILSFKLIVELIASSLRLLPLLAKL